MRTLRILAYIFFVLLAVALIWRAFFYVAEHAPVAEAPVPAPTAQQLSEADIVLDLFNPSEAVVAGQVGESTRKRQIEEAMTIGFMLRHCNYIDDSEYRDTYRALLTYAQRSQPGVPPDQVAAEMQRTVESSSASYSLIYSRVSCDAPQLRASAKQLAQWREALLNPAK